MSSDAKCKYRDTLANQRPEGKRKRLDSNSNTGAALGGTTDGQVEFPLSVTLLASGDKRDTPKQSQFPVYSQTGKQSPLEVLPKAWL